jgi:hypothetical protein
MPHSGTWFPDDLGPHRDEVMAVLRLVESAFGEKQDLRTERFLCLHRLPSRCHPHQGPDNLELDDCPPNTPSLHDLVENDLGDALAALRNKPYRHSASDFFEKAESKAMLFSRIPLALKDYTHWILDDIAMIALYRCAFGKQDSLLESMFQAYKAGGFPIGYNYNEHRQIRVLVFLPT